MRQDQRWFFDLLDHIRNSEGLAGACHSEQHLMLVTVVDAIHNLPDSFGLVAGRDVF